MTSEEYNDRLFSLIQRNSEWPYKNVPAFDQQSAAKSAGTWCKTLMDVYQTMRREDVACRPPESYGIPSVDILGSASSALATLKACFKNDQHYADTWHDNIAIDVYESLERRDASSPLASNHVVANDTASAIMRRFFDVSTLPPYNRGAGPEATPPEFKDDESGTVLDPVLYEQVSSVVQMELKEFLERARDASKVNQDRSFLEYLLAYVTPPTVAKDDIADF